MRRGASLLLAAVAIHAQPLFYTLLPAEGAKPAARFDGTIAYDPAGARIYLFAGSSDAGPVNDLWSYSLDARTWTKIDAPNAPPARFGHTLVFDPARRRLVLFGGQASGFFNDTWMFDIATGAWRELARGQNAPSRRYGHSGIVDPPGDRMIISHGFTNSGRFDDTWAFDFASNQWRDISPAAGRPLRRCLHHAVYDPGNRQMLLYGGCASPQGPCPLGDLWSFDLASNRWTERTPSARPPAREHFGIGFDGLRSRLVLFGGAGNGDLGDTWEWDPRGNTWSQPRIAGAAPSARSRHESASAPDRGAVFFFGGFTATGATNELWMLGPPLVSGPRTSREGVLNALSGRAGPVAPGGLVMIVGEGLGPGEGIALDYDPLTGALPVSGPGVEVTVNGTPAPLLFVSATQINAQIPYEVEGAAEAVIQVNVLRQTAAVTVPVSAASPGLLNRVYHEDGSANSAENPAMAESTVTLYATGLGQTNPPERTGLLSDGVPEPVGAVSVTIGDLAAEVVSRRSIADVVGMTRIVARIPAGVSGAVTARVAVEGAVSQDVMVVVRQDPATVIR